MKREKESDVEVLKAVGQVRDDVAKMAEQVNRLVAEKQTATSKFCLYVESEMNLLPPAAVMELQNEIYRLINEKKTFLLRQNMMSYCPTPAPSLSSPCPAVNDWQYQSWISEEKKKKPIVPYERRKLVTTMISIWVPFRRIFSYLNVLLW